MRIGLIGLEKSGKTTIYNALTKREMNTDLFGGQQDEPNIAVIDVLDPRIEVLSMMYEPKKTVYATIEVIDFAGVTSGSGKTGLFTPVAMNMIKQSDALALVVRNFRDEAVTGAFGPPSPLDDIGTVMTELVLSDLVIAERRLERIESEYKKGKKTPELQSEEKTVRKVYEALITGSSVRNISLTAEELKRLSGFQFLSIKPILVILNSDEDNYGKNSSLLASIHETYEAVEFAGKFEMELGHLDAGEAGAFMEDIGITESARARLTTAAFDILGCISFFTVGKDEVRAWTIHKSDNAAAAAGAIHSDLARGFIRAECFTFDDITSCGSEKGVKEKGLLRLEGKNYLVQDGDILSIRYSV
ncbi:MAG: redox-regulated ATPase YchF [Spirochaetales bacterium]|nr:redox-regulated ATPase YchF [Spirochaetales bacterium]